MVGRDAVDGAVAQALDQRLAVVLGPQRRVHLEAGVEAADRLVGERQVVRRRLAGDPDARLPSRARSPRPRRGRRGAGRGSARPRRAASEQSRAIIVDSETAGTPAMPSAAETSPSCIDPARGELRVLLVQGDHAAGQALVLERAAHHARAARSAGRRRRSRSPPPRAARPSRSAPGRAIPRVTLATKPTGIEASPLCPVADRAEDRRPSRWAARCWPSRSPRSSRRPRRRECPSRGPPCAPGPGRGGGRAGRRRPGSASRPSPSTTSAPSTSGALPGSAISAISPSRTTRSRAASRPVRGSNRRAPRIEQSAPGPGREISFGPRRRLAGSVGSDVHAGCPIVGGVGGRRPALAAGLDRCPRAARRGSPSGRPARSRPGR